MHDLNSLQTLDAVPQATFLAVTTTLVVIIVVLLLIIVVLAIYVVYKLKESQSGINMSLALPWILTSPVQCLLITSRWRKALSLARC